MTDLATRNACSEITVGDRVKARGWSHDWTVRAIYRGIAALTDDRGDDGFNTAWLPLADLTRVKPEETP